MTTVLGIDVALDWQSIGSALLTFDAESSTFVELKARESTGRQRR